MKNVKFVKKALAVVMAAAMSLSMAACGSSAASSAAASSASSAASNAAAAETQETSAAGENADTAEGTVYKVGIVKYVDDASLDQIEGAIQAECRYGDFSGRQGNSNGAAQHRQLPDPLVCAEI